MEKIIILMTILTLVTINQVYCKNVPDVNSILRQGAVKNFDVSLKNHTKNINEKYAPFTQFLKSKGCQLTLTNNDYKTQVHVKIQSRVESCDQLTNSVGYLERLILDTVYLGKDYGRLTLLALQNATGCLSNEDLTLGSICLLRAVDDYGAQIGTLNNDLIQIIISEVDTTNLIVKYFVHCFENRTTTTNLKTIARVYAETFCVNESINLK